MKDLGRYRAERSLNSQWEYAPVLRRGSAGTGQLQVSALFKDTPSCYATAMQHLGVDLMRYLMHHSVGTMVHDPFGTWQPAIGFMT